MDDEIHILMNEINNLFKLFISKSNIHVYTNHLLIARYSFVYSHTAFMYLLYTGSAVKYLLYSGQCIRCYVYSEEQDGVPKELMTKKKNSGLVVEIYAM